MNTTHKLGSAIKDCIDCADGDLHPSDIEARKRGEPIHTDLARAELRQLMDAALIVRALSNPSGRYTVILTPNRWSVVDTKPNDCRSLSSGYGFVNGIPVLDDAARRHWGRRERHHIPHLRRVRIRSRASPRRAIDQLHPSKDVQRGLQVRPDGQAPRQLEPQGVPVAADHQGTEDPRGHPAQCTRSLRSGSISST